MTVRVLKHGRVVVERARLMAYRLGDPKAGGTSWAGAFALERAVEGHELLLHPLELQLPDGSQATVQVRRLFGGVLAQFSGIGSPPEGIV